MSTCSACLRGTTPPPRGSSSKNLSKKSSKRLPPPRGDLPPKVERPTPASAAWISQRCSTLWPSPGTTRLTVTTAGLMPHTSHILVAIFFCLLKVYPPRGEVLSVGDKRSSNLLPDRRPFGRGEEGTPIREDDGARGAPPLFHPRSRLLAARAAAVRAIASPDLDALGFLDGCRSRDLDLQDAILKVSFDLILIHVLGQLQASAERARTAFPDQVSATFLFPLFLEFA